jgi:hypothetical protein
VAGIDAPSADEHADTDEVSSGAVTEGAIDSGEVCEWGFALWDPSTRTGVVEGFRRFAAQRRGWLWAAVVTEGQPVIHIAEWDIPLRSDPYLAKAPGLWAEHRCEAPDEQWTFGLETYGVALEDPLEALGRAYGDHVPVAWDLEWYATRAVEVVDGATSQAGVVHGVVELSRGPLEFVEAPTRRWFRSGSGPAPLPRARAHWGLRAMFAFPGGVVADLVVADQGWCHRG